MLTHCISGQAHRFLGSLLSIQKLPAAALRGNGKWQLLMALFVRHFAHVCANEFAGNLRVIISTAKQACLQL